MRRYQATSRALLALAMLLVGCISGKTPPTPSARVTVAADTYVLGLSSSVALACDANTPEFGRCDVGTGGDVATYAAELGWVPNLAADLPAFRIDATEVSNAQYAFCVDSEACSEPAYTEAAGIVDYYHGSANARLPVVWVSWKQAAAYCAFVGGRLPNEAEWEAAARYGATEAEQFPWGVQKVDCVEPSDPDHVPFKGCHGPHAVGTAAKDRTNKQVYDLASNVREWVADGWRGDAYCEKCTRVGDTCSECASAGCVQGCGGIDICPAKAAYSPVDGSADSAWVVRGGSFKFNRCFHRIFVRQRETVAREDLGFRCAYAER